MASNPSTMGTAGNGAELPALAAARLAPANHEEMAALHYKLDLLTQQVSHLYKRSMAIEELKDELVLIARDALVTLRSELGAMEHEFNSEALAQLLRQLLRNTPRIARMLDLMRSAQDFVDDVGPVGKEVMRDIVDRLQTWEERGYFQLGCSAADLADKIAQEITPDDLERFASSVEVLADTLRLVTRPEMLTVVNDAVGVLANGRESRPVGMWGLMGAMREPQVQQGLGILVDVLRRIGASAAAPPALTDSSKRLTDNK